VAQQERHGEHNWYREHTVVMNCTEIYRSVQHDRLLPAGSCGIAVFHCSMMQKNMPKWGIVLMAAVIAVWVGLLVTPAVADAPVEQTGQTTSFAAGDDGDIQAGHPLPTPRFKDEGNGTVEDKLTDLIWLKNADCFGPRTWADALNAANNLAAPRCGLSDGSVAGDWRFPNVKELQSLIHFGFFNPALSNAAGTGQWTEGNAFSGVQSAGYWSSTTLAGFSDFAWFVFSDGRNGGGAKDVSTALVWPVRGGQ
jgi:hypothetical protein